MSDVNAAYAYVCSNQASARHVLGAYSIPGRAFHTLKDSYDDDEHGVSAELLDILESSNINNKAVFVARFYDGTHIGKKRIDAIIEAARNAILTRPRNTITGKNDYPLTKDEILEARFPKNPVIGADRRKGVTQNWAERTEATSNEDELGAVGGEEPAAEG